MQKLQNRLVLGRWTGLLKPSLNDWTGRWTYFSQDVFVLEQWTVLFKMSLFWNNEPFCSRCLCSGTVNRFAQAIFVLENHFAQDVFALGRWTVLLKPSLFWSNEPFCPSLFALIWENKPFCTSCLCSGTKSLILTLIKSVKRALSPAGLPLLAGYSQSTSSPSNPFFRRKGITDWINWARDCCVATICVKGPEAMFHPPKASSVFMAGFFCFNAWKRSNLWTIMHGVLKCTLVGPQSPHILPVVDTEITGLKARITRVSVY